MVKRSVFGGILAVAGLFVLQGSALTFAETTGSATFSVDIANPILELTVPSNPAVIDLNPTMTGAAFGSADLTIHVATNNQTGYTLTMTPQSSDNNDPYSLIRTELLSGEQDYRIIETLAQTSPASTGYTESTFTANKWGYRILSNSNYYGIDSTNPTVSSTAWTTNEPTNGTNHNLTVAAKVDADTVSGSYETTLVFTATTNAVVAKDNITFNGNGADNSTAMDNISFSVLSGTTGTLPTNQYTRTGYAFLGWNTASDGSGRTYANEGVYTATSTTYSNNVTLYAMWEDTTSPIYNILHPGGSGLGSGVTISLAYEIAYTAAGKGMWERDEGDRDNDGDTNEYYQVTDGVYHNYDVRWDMQGMTPEICNSVTVTHDDYQAMDIRDWKLYHITKLKDGNCWMTQNLDLNIDSSKTYTNLDTDLGWNRQMNIYETASWAPNRSTVNQTTQWARSNFDSPVSYDPGDWYYTDTYGNGNSCRSDSNYQSCNYIHPIENTHYTEYFSTTPYQGNGMHGHVGNYYNYNAATATNDSSTHTEYSYDDPTKSPQTSICPRGWRLPTTAPYLQNDFTNLLVEYSSMYYDNTTSRSYYWADDEFITEAPLYFIRAGQLADWTTSPIYAGIYGYYWSNTTSVYPHHASYFHFYNTRVEPESQYDRYYGYSIRCIAR